MRLLIITQKVDQNDDVLGFFHGWIAEFAKHCEQVTVIALGVGEHHLPKNVRVFSLGKERAVSRIGYLINFYRLIWRERKNYDVVFVHMNQEYVLLGGLLWKFFGKKISMWRNHYAGSFLTRMAMMLSDKLFCTSKYSFTAQSKKTTLMPVGIDTDLFKKENNAAKKPNSVLFLARIAPAKKPDLVIEALHVLENEDILFTADFYGNALPQDVLYLNALKEKVKEHFLSEHITFERGIPNRQTPGVYGAHTVFINTSPSGMYDKTIFEAMACESLILTSNLNLKDQVDDRFLFSEDDAYDLAEKLEELLILDAEEQVKYGKELRMYVSQYHSLSALGKKLVDILSK
jgi:glycosyltransferase involved in cell wall biosynthesis